MHGNEIDHICCRLDQLESLVYGPDCHLQSVELKSSSTKSIVDEMLDISDSLQHVKSTKCGGFVKQVWPEIDTVFSYLHPDGMNALLTPPPLPLSTCAKAATVFSHELELVRLIGLLNEVVKRQDVVDRLTDDLVQTSQDDVVAKQWKSNVKAVEEFGLELAALISDYDDTVGKLCSQLSSLENQISVLEVEAATDVDILTENTS